MKKDKIRESAVQGGKKLKGVWVALFWLLLWTAAAAALHKPLLLPGPWDTLLALWRMVQTGLFWESALLSLARVMSGYLCAVLLGAALAFACFFSSLADSVLSPLRTIIRSTPVTSFIILVLLWLDTGIVPAFISFLMVLPIVWTSVQEGLNQTDAALLEMTECYHYSAVRRFRYLYVPSAVPYFSAACANGLGFAWKSGIAAEVIAKPLFSIGKNLQDAKVYLETTDLFAWTLIVILLSLALEKLLRRIISKIRVRGGGER